MIVQDKKSSLRKESSVKDVSKTLVGGMITDGYAWGAMCYKF